MQPDKALRADVLDIIFEDRNKEYGAYTLRKNYAKSMNRAFIITLLLLAFAFSLPYVVKLLTPKEEEVLQPKKKASRVVELDEPPPLEDKPKPEVFEAPPLEKTIQFVPPEITKEEVKEEEKLPEVTELKNVNIGNESHEGDTIVGNPDLSNENKVIGTGDEDNKPLMYAEQQPEFPGGAAAMMQWLSEHINYPRAAKENNVTGRVVVNFVVDADGNVTKVKVAKSVPGLDEEAVRVVQSMPKWKAGRQNGKAVSVYYNLPVKFVLQ